MKKIIESLLTVVIICSMFSQCRKDVQKSNELSSTNVKESAQFKKQPSNCPDLEVTQIIVDTIANPNPAYIRFRFRVFVENTSKFTYDPSPVFGTHYISLNFTAPGYIERPMAQQNMFLPMNPGDVQQMLFEVNIDRVTKTLPDWEDMPTPTDYCGAVLTGTVPANYECTISNNKLCEKDKFIKKILK